MIPVPLDEKVIAALELLGFEISSVITVANVKVAFKTLARQHHPDLGGTEKGMKLLNDAYETALEWVKNIEEPKCICLGFTRNKLCRAHEDSTTSDVQCAECGGTKKVEAGPEWARVKLDCPKCTQ